MTFREKEQTTTWQRGAGQQARAQETLLLVKENREAGAADYELG